VDLSLVLFWDYGVQGILRKVTNEMKLRTRDKVVIIIGWIALMLGVYAIFEGLAAIAYPCIAVMVISWLYLKRIDKKLPETPKAMRASLGDKIAQAVALFATIAAIKFMSLMIGVPDGEPGTVYFIMGLICSVVMMISGLYLTASAKRAKRNL
jgi:hypothetical protein